MASRIKVATWNLKQAVAPRAPLPERWAWAEQTIDADVFAFTEAAVPKDGAPSGWCAQFDPGGIDSRRPWGTILAARNGIELQPVEEVRRRFRRRELGFTWPGAVRVADVVVDRERWATVVALYGINLDAHGNKVVGGRFSLPRLLDELSPLIRSSRGQRLIVAGDFNLHPRPVRRELRDRRLDDRLVDLIDLTEDSRPTLVGCSGCSGGQRCGHIWTHRNGTSPNAQRQQIDYILASPELAASVRSVVGGPDEFPGAWDMSDHAPVVAEFGL